MERKSLSTEFEDGDLVSGLTRKGQRLSPRRAYGTLMRMGRVWSVGSWKVDPGSVRRVKGKARRALVRIFQKTSGHCHFCGDPLDFEKLGRKYPKGWEKDHVIPKKRGGKRQQANLLPIHWRCNSLRRKQGFDRLKTLIRVGLIGIEEMKRKRETDHGRWLKDQLDDRKRANRQRRTRHREKNSVRDS